MMARGNISRKEEKKEERKTEHTVFQTVLLKGYIKKAAWEAAILIYKRILKGYHVATTAFFFQFDSIIRIDMTGIPKLKRQDH